MAVSAVAALVSTAGAVGGSLVTGTAFTFLNFAPGLTSALAFFGASTAMGAALNALAPKPTASNSGYSVTSRGGNLSHQIIYGRTRVSGVVVAERLAGEGSNTGTRFLHQIIALAGHEIESFDEVYVDGKRVATWYEDPSSKTTDVTSIASYVDTDADIFVKDIYDVDEDGANVGDAERPFYDANNVSMRFFSGTDAQTASTAIQTDMFNGDSALWGTNHRLRGIAYVHVIMGYDPNAFRNGVPEFAFTVKGKKVYDPRTASTAYSNNPALCLRDYLVSDYGLSEDTARIDDTLVTTAANICETADTWNTDQYTCNGTFLTGGQPYDIMRDLLTSMGGRLWYAQGQWRMKAAAWVASVQSFDEDDLRGPVQVQTRHSMRDNFNTVTGSFRGEQTSWTVTEYPPVSNATFVTEDNSRVTKVDVAFPFTENADMCRKLARIILERNREQLTLNLTLGLKGFKVQVGDNISLTLSRFGWTSKTFEVVDWSFGLANEGDLQTNVTVREIQSSVFDDVDDGVTYDGSNPVSTNVSADIVPEFINNSVTYDAYTGGANTPVLISLWTAGDESAVNYYEFSYRLTEFDYASAGGEAAYPTSPTSREIAVWDLYAEILGRVPDADGYAYYISGAGSGTTIDDLREEFLSSTEASSQTVHTSIQVNDTRYELRGLKENDAYDVRIRAVAYNGTKSKWVADYVEIVVDTVAPAVPTSVSATGDVRSIKIDWTNPTDEDLRFVEVYENTSNTTSGATLVATVASDTYTRVGLASDTTRWYFLKSVDYVGNKSAYTSGVSATTTFVVDDDFENGIRTLFEDQGLFAIEDVVSLPGSGTTTGEKVFNRSDGKLYEWDGASWNLVVAAVEAPDISGQLAAAQLATNSVTSDKIVSNAITETKISSNAVTTGKIATNAITANEIAANTITASQISAGAITANELAANSVTSAKIVAGTIQASDIQTGTLTATQIAANTITGNKITANTITGGLLATSGIITSSAQIGSGLITEAKIGTAAVTSAKIGTAAITNAKIGNLAVDTLQIAGSAVETDKILDGAVTGRDSATDTGTRSISSNTPTDLMSPSAYAVVDTGSYSADILVTFQFDFSRTVSTDVHYFRLIRNSTNLQVWSLDEFQKDLSSGTIVGTYIDTGRGTGSDQYYLQGYKDPTTSNGCDWSNITVLVAGWVR